LSKQQMDWLRQQSFDLRCTYELKLDGYRLEVVRSAGETAPFSRTENIIDKKFGFMPMR